MSEQTAGFISGSSAAKKIQWKASKAPARPKIGTITVSTVASIIALLLLAAMTVFTNQQWLIPPMAASMALVVGAPQLPLAQPRNVIGGQAASALVGVLVGLMGDSIWLAALAGGLALGAMMFLRMPHSPAAATAIIGVSTGASWTFVLLAAGSALVLVLVGLIGNRANGVQYPVYVW